MNKSLLIPIIGAFALSMLTGCKEKVPQVTTVEATLDEVIANKNNLDNHTRYHITNVRPYSFHKGDGQSYPASSFYFFAQGSSGISTYIAAMACTTDVSTHTKEGFKFTIDSLDVANKVEKDIVGKGANTDCVYEVYYYNVHFTHYRDTVVEIVNFTPVVE